MKQELLEYLIRHCIREVLSQVKEIDSEAKGALAPPSDGTGTMALANTVSPMALDNIDEDLQKMIKKIINEVLDGR